MNELELFSFMQNNRIIFSYFFLSGVLFSFVVVVVAYLFRNLPSAVRFGAMISSLIGLVMLAIFTTIVQNIAFEQLSTLSQMAANGSEIASNFIVNRGINPGEEVSPPTWLMVLGFSQIAINLALTVYIFMFAKWDS